MKKVISILLISLLVISSGFSIFIGISYDKSSESDEKASINLQNPRVPEHDESIWAGKYFGFSGQALNVMNSASLVVTGDLNQDNYSDLAVISQPNGPISIFFWNTTKHNFSIEPQIVISQYGIFLQPGQPKLLAIGDLNNDTKNDIAYVWYDNSGGNTYLSFLLQNASGVYETKPVFPDYPIRNNPVALLIDQYNDEIGNDIIIVCRGTSDIGAVERLFYVPTSKKFDPPLTLISIGSGITASCSIRNTTVGGPSDIAIGFDSGQIKIYRPPLDVPSPSFYNISVVGSIIDLESGYLNSDSPVQLKDILVITESPEKAYIFYRQSPSQKFQATDSKNLTLLFIPLDSAIGDLNSDGLDDIAITSHNPIDVTKIFFQRSSPIWNQQDYHLLSSIFNPISISIADFDNDTLMDICEASFTNQSSSPIGIYFQYENRDISSSDSTIFLKEFDNPSDFILGEFSENNSQVIILNETSNTAKLYDFTGNELTHLFSFITGPMPIEISSGRFNNDTYEDFVIIDGLNRTISLFLGNDLLNISSYPTNETNCSGVPTGIAISDINNDTLDDIVISTENEGLQIYINEGENNPLPSVPIIIGTLNVSYACPVIDYINNDDRPDIIASKLDGGPTIEIYYQRDNGDFPAVDESIPTGGILITSIETDDFDGDNDIDIVSASNYTAKVMLHYQTGGSFPNTVEINTTEPVADIISYDLTDDGAEDILVIMPDASLAQLFVQSATGIRLEPQESLLLSSNSTKAIGLDSDNDQRNDIWVLSSGSKAIQIWSQLNRPPAVDISPQFLVTEGVVAEISVTVRDGASEAGIHNITWNFGDGNITTDPGTYTPINATSGIYSITHLYQDEGIVNIIINITDSGLLTTIASSEAVISDFIPTGQISPSPSDPKEGQEITISAINVTSWDPIIGYSWKIDAENISTSDSSFQYRFLSDGNHTIELIINDEDGSSNPILETIEVEEALPVVYIDAPVSGSEGEEILFKAIEDELLNADNITSFEWDFDYDFVDFHIDTTTNETSHIFNAIGDYQDFIVALRTNDTDGSVNITTSSIRIFDSVPYANFSWVPDPIIEGRSFNLTDTSSAYDGITGTSWYVENKSSESFDEYHNQSSITLILDNGTYLINMKITDSDWSVSWKNESITVFSEKPIVSLERDVLSGLTTFDAIELKANILSYDEINRYEWDLDFNGTFSSDNVTFTPNYVLSLDSFEQQGVYRIAVRAYDIDNEWGESNISIHVGMISISGYSGSIIVRNNTTLMCLVSDEIGSVANLSWSLDCGQLNSFGPSDYSIELNEWDEGEYVLYILLVNSEGDLAIEKFAVIVDNTPPIIEITYQKTKSFVGDDINITVFIDEPHLRSDKVYLHYSFGDIEMPLIKMHSAGEGVYWAIIPGPSNTGQLRYNVTAEDLAGNIGTSGDSVNISIVNHLLTQIWPFASIGAILAAIGFIAIMRIEAMTAVDETFVIYEDGRLISHQTRRLKPDMDHDVLSGMFVAVQEFVKDSFKDETIFDLRKLEFGDKTIIVEKGSKIFLAVVLQGRQSRRVIRRMGKVSKEIEAKYADVLIDWDGDIDRMRGVQEITRRLYHRGFFGAESRWFRRAT